MDFFSKKKEYKKLEDINESKTENQIKKKRSFLEIVGLDSKKVSENDINKVISLASKDKSDISDFNDLVNKVRPIRMWVRENKEHLTSISSSIEEFDAIAAEAKQCKDNAAPFISMQMYNAPIVIDNIKTYREHIRGEMEIAHRLYRYINHELSNS